MYGSKLFKELEQLEIEVNIDVWELSIEQLVKLLYRIERITDN